MNRTTPYHSVLGFSNWFSWILLWFVPWFVSSLDLGLGQHPLIGLSATSVIQARVVGLLKPPLFAIGSVASKTHTALCLLWCKVVTFTHSSLLEYSSLIRLDCCTASHLPGGSQLMLSCPCIGGELALETCGRNAAHDGYDVW